MIWDWMDESNVFPATIGTLIAMYAEHACEIVIDARTDFRSFSMSGDDLELWNSFYSSPRDMWTSCVMGLYNENPQIADYDVDPGIAHFFNKEGHVFDGELSVPAQQIVSALHFHKEGFKGALPLGLRFFYQIVIPCWLLYGDTPEKVYGKAIAGDILSLSKLLILDKLIIASPRISREIALANAQPDSTQQDVIARAIGREPKQLSRGKIKVLIAAFIYKLCEFIDHPLTYPELRHIFDALAFERGLGEIDTDLHDSSESFAKAVKRDLEFWKCFNPIDETATR